MFNWATAGMLSIQGLTDTDCFDAVSRQNSFAYLRLLFYVKF